MLAVKQTFNTFTWSSSGLLQLWHALTFRIRPVHLWAVGTPAMPTITQKLFEHLKSRLSADPFLSFSISLASFSTLHAQQVVSLQYSCAFQPLALNFRKTIDSQQHETCRINDSFLLGRIWEPLGNHIKQLFVTSAASVAPDKVATIDPFDDRW